MKTITYNPETHVLVPREPTLAMYAAALAFDDNKPLNDWGKIVSITYEETYSAMLAAAPQPEPVESEPVAYYSAHYKTPTGTKEFHGLAENPLPAGTKLYTTPQPDRTAELEAALKVARDALNTCTHEGFCDYDDATEAIAKINEVLHD